MWNDVTDSNKNKLLEKACIIPAYKKHLYLLQERNNFSRNFTTL